MTVSLNIIPLEHSFGAVIDNIRLDIPDEHLDAQLQAALLEYGLLIIRDQQLAPQQQVVASALFGALEIFPHAPGQIRGLPQIFRLASRSGEGYRDVGRYWHSDGSFRANPTPISIWHSIDVPEQGGDTLFTDLREAYRVLSDEEKCTARGVQTFHRNGVQHPLVMLHPITGKPALYINVGLTSAIADMDIRQAGELIKHLDTHLSRPGAVYGHVWQPGDVVVADNLRVAHQATVTPPEFRRVLDRTTIAAGTAYSKVQAALTEPELASA
jgi:taurine dioxygenase